MKHLTRASESIINLVALFCDLFFWGVAGLLHYTSINGIESWDIVDSFSYAWRGMLSPTPFLIGQTVGLVMWWSLKTMREKPEDTFFAFWGDPTSNDLVKIRNLDYDKSMVVRYNVTLTNADETVFQRIASWIRSYKIYESRVKIFEQSESRLVFNFKDSYPIASIYQSMPRFIELRCTYGESSAAIEVLAYPAVVRDKFDLDLARVYWVNFVIELVEKFGSKEDQVQLDSLLSSEEKRLRFMEYHDHPRRMVRFAFDVFYAFFLVCGGVSAVGIYFVRGSWEPVFELIVWMFGICAVGFVGLAIIGYVQVVMKINGLKLIKENTHSM